MRTAREEFMKNDSDLRLRKALNSNIRPNPISEI